MSCYALLVARLTHLLAPSAFVFALFACGGASDPGLFSGGGASAGTHNNSAGASNSAGSPGTAGDASTPPSEGGDSTVGGSVGVAGQDSGGSNSSGGSAAGSDTGGSAGSTAHAGAGGSAAGAGGSSAGSAGTAGTGGSVSTEPTCKDLYAKAATQLEAARACNVAKNAEQCTGTVKTTCNCEVPVESEGSAETQAYEATLKQINQKKCSQVCAAIACSPVNHAQCRANSASTVVGTCVSNFTTNF